MRNINKLAKKLLIGRTPTLFYKRYNDGTEQNPDVIIYHLYATVEDFNGNRDIIINLDKEDDEAIFETCEIYRFPYITNLNILKTILKKAIEQSHS